jgi:hypothetical protein
MTVSLEEATTTLNQLSAKVQQGDADGGNDILAEMKVNKMTNDQCFEMCPF